MKFLRVNLVVLRFEFQVLRFELQIAIFDLKVVKFVKFQLNLFRIKSGESEPTTLAIGNEPHIMSRSERTFYRFGLV